MWYHIKSVNWRQRNCDSSKDSAQKRWCLTAQKEKSIGFLEVSDEKTNPNNQSSGSFLTDSWLAYKKKKRIIMAVGDKTGKQSEMKVQ